MQVLKVAILSEKYASDYTWYVDTILQLIRVAGDYVSEEVWHRVIQIVINRDDAQGYAAKTVFEVRLLERLHVYRLQRDLSLMLNLSFHGTPFGSFFTNLGIPHQTLARLFWFHQHPWYTIL